MDESRRTHMDLTGPSETQQLDSDELLRASDSDDPPVGILVAEGQPVSYWGRRQQGTLLAEGKMDRGIDQRADDTHDRVAHDAVNVTAAALHTPNQQHRQAIAATAIVPNRPVKVKPAVSGTQSFFNLF